MFGYVDRALMYALLLVSLHWFTKERVSAGERRRFWWAASVGAVALIVGCWHEYGQQKGVERAEARASSAEALQRDLLARAERAEALQRDLLARAERAEATQRALVTLERMKIDDPQDKCKRAFPPGPDGVPVPTCNLSLSGPLHETPAGREWRIRNFGWSAPVFFFPSPTSK
jgi:hypothetical protein